MKHPWELAYQTKSFSINTLTPSILVDLHKDKLKEGDKVLDIGCGNGRNAIFLASRGIHVDCFDVADLDWVKTLPDQLNKYIDFEKTTITDWRWKENFYRGIILARVIQYLSDSELEYLLNKIHTSLIEGGILMLSYSVSGGIHERKEIEVPKFIHPVENIKQSLSNLFKEVQIMKGANTSAHVNYRATLESYDIVAYK